MGRGYVPVVIAICAATIAGGAAAAQQRPLLPAGGMWQSIPYEESLDGPKAPSTTTSQKAATTGEKVGPAKAAKPAAATNPAAVAKPVAAAKPISAKPKKPRQPVPAAAVSEPAPNSSAAAKTKELERRIGILSPGTKLGEAMADPENPSWRRPRPGRPAGEANSLSVPFDDKGQSGFIARGYHQQPDVQVPNGNTGATFGLRTRF
jgi:hypothetical protein